jgi:hypothetical protein
MNTFKVAIAVCAVGLMSGVAGADDAKPLRFMLQVNAPVTSETDYFEGDATTSASTIIRTPLVGWTCTAIPVGPPQMTGNHLVQTLPFYCESAAGKVGTTVACRLTSEATSSYAAFFVEDKQGHSALISAYCSNSPASTPTRVRQ